MQQVEEFNVSPIEQELSFKIWCQERDIKAMLFDGDDTLWKTVPIFRGQMEKCYDLLTETGIWDRETWIKKVEMINNELFEKLGVNPIRWKFVVEQLGQYGLKNDIQEQTRQILEKIYQIPPMFVEGTEKGLVF